MEEYELSYYSWSHSESFIRNDLFSKEKKIPITQWRKHNWETGIWRDTQSSFESLDVTCLDAKKLQKILKSI